MGYIIGDVHEVKHTKWASSLITTTGTKLLKVGYQSSCEMASTERPASWPTDPQLISYLQNTCCKKMKMFRARE